MCAWVDDAYSCICVCAIAVSVSRLCFAACGVEIFGVSLAAHVSQNVLLFRLKNHSSPPSSVASGCLYEFVRDQISVSSSYPSHFFVFHRMVGCTPFLVVSYFYLWFVPPFASSRFIWYLGFYCLYQTLITVSMHAPSDLKTLRQRSRTSPAAQKTRQVLAGDESPDICNSWFADDMLHNEETKSRKCCK